MGKDPKSKRELAVQRFVGGEKAASICASLGRSRAWLYKWVKRFQSHHCAWSQNLSRRPSRTPRQTSPEMEEMVVRVRLDLSGQGLFCGAQAVLWEMAEMGVSPLPSVRTVNRIFRRRGMMRRREGRYVSKKKPYPALPASRPNQSHQADFVGPRYLKGPFRFYSLNVVDLATGRCSLEPLKTRSAQDIIDGFWAVWRRMGIPRSVQVDNEMCFYGSLRHPRGMGPLIRLCLHLGVEPWFIPTAEPWRNGVVEKFNDHYQQKLLGRVAMNGEDDLRKASLAFEHRHNSRYRYSKLRGKTPLETLAEAGAKLSFPKQERPPKHPLKKPDRGRYHLVRFIRSDLKLNVFGEIFKVPSELQYEYIVATIDVKEQKLKLNQDSKQIGEITYKLR